MIQLHYKEIVAQTAEIAAELLKLGIKTIRAVYEDTHITELCETEIGAILVDSRTSENASDNDLAVDTKLFRRIKEKSQLRKPLIIAGGITPENVSDIIAQTGADWIDVMSGVEHSPGVKNRIKLTSLISTLFPCDSH